MKITYARDTNKLSARLKEVLDLVHAKRPLLEYEVIEGIKDEATKVVVYQDGQRIGKLNADRRRYSPSKGANEIWFAIEAHTIKKERGDSNTRFCKDVKTAARIAIESFAKKSLTSLGEELIIETVSGVSNVSDKVHYVFSNAINYSITAVSTYFLDVMAGKNPPIPQKIQDQIISKDLARLKDNYDICANVYKHSKNKNGYAMCVMQDESLLIANLADPSATSKHASTYELDESIQEKFTMLKLLDENQCAADIGVKFKAIHNQQNVMIYFIVAGKTVTH